MGNAADNTNLGRGFDRGEVDNVVKRFLAVNALRLERARQAMNDRQLHFLNALPLMFHTNHEKLPGFSGHDCPCGVARFSAGKEDVHSAMALYFGYQFQQRRRGEVRIKSLFAMGSSGSLGHSGGSDLDIWLCHDPRLNEKEIEALSHKCKGIEKAGADVGLEVHFFLMDAERFRRGDRNDLNGEDCGSAQHQLLLDEFYRSAILLAGAYPVWWLVPPHMEDQYDDFVFRLDKQGYIQTEDVIDFGGVGEIPAGEFIGAGMWQLYKGIESPYKSILKLLLTEIYASSYPQIKTISLDFKTRVYDSEFPLHKLDPYLLLYNRLEEYLSSREELDRLELVRRCLYFKANVKISQAARKKNWKRDIMQNLVQDWRWQEHYLIHLDARGHWHVSTVMEERKQLVAELIHSYKFLSQFSRRHQQETLLNAQDMTLLGHKLYAAFDRKPGKIELINPGISKDVYEEKLSLHLNKQHVKQRIPSMAWALYMGVVRPDMKVNPIRKSHSLIEVLAWAHVNQVMEPSTQLAMYQGRSHAKDYELKEITSRLNNFPLPQSKQANFDQPPKPRCIYLFVNVFIDPMGHFTRKGIHKISNRTDSLGFSALRENLVLTIDQLTLNSWNEVLVSRYEGQTALLRCVEDYLVACQEETADTQPELQVFCFCATRPQAITARVRALFDEIRACFFSSSLSKNARFVLEIAGHYHVIQQQGGRPLIYHFESIGGLLIHLQKPQPGYSQIVLDSHALRGTPLKLMCENAHPGRIQVFYIKRNELASVYVLDERGSLSSWQTPFYNEASLLNPLHHFLRQVEYRENRHRYSDPEQVQERIIEYNEILLPDGDQGMRLRPTRPNEGFGRARFFDIHAQVDFDAQNRLSFTLICQREEFSDLDHGEDIYKAVARHLVSLRKSGEHYPLYITDLSIADRLHQRNQRQVLQTARYLIYKLRLERQLNKALGELKQTPPSEDAE